MTKKPSFFGNHPFPPQSKRPVLVTRERTKEFIYPSNNPHVSDFNRLMVSSDKLTFGIYQLPPGAAFYPPDVHAGDEVYYILKGTLTVLNPETGQCIEVNQGESILLPKGAAHMGSNFTAEELSILWAIAPQIWDDAGAPLEYRGEMKLLKFGDGR
jgi:mannose-6-phosphate isomerase-like protein (cupin superfamily)